MKNINTQVNAYDFPILVFLEKFLEIIGGLNICIPVHDDLHDIVVQSSQNA